MASFETVFKRLCELYPDPQERGRRFERIMADVFRTDPLYRGRYSNVWLWREWPGRRSGDIGVDIVAERADGEGLAAIQVKCKDPNSTLSHAEINSFLAFTNAQFSERIIVSTTSNETKNVRALIDNQEPPVQRLSPGEIDSAPIDWDECLRNLGIENAPLHELPSRGPLPHQRDALQDIRTKFGEHDRGKLIMACGTGKTFTALRAAEEQAGRGGRVLFAAPSISLVAQALREWSRDARMPIRPFVVCSDASVGSKDGDSARGADLPIPPTTRAARLVQYASPEDGDRMTVVFTTYQSMSVIRDAQAAGMPAFDLVVCDEAHRTTGYALKGEEQSNFLLVHDSAAIRARKRLYMTATPRIYAPQAKRKAADAEAYVASMDDEETYGPEFHRLGFGRAVQGDLLCDYKVAILVVSENQITDGYSKELTDGSAVGDVGRAIGCLNGLAKVDPDGEEFADDEAPMRRAIAFSTTIKNSRSFVDLVERLQDDQAVAERGLRVSAQHVDGGGAYYPDGGGAHRYRPGGAAQRAARIRWLDDAMQAEGQCHLLSNARCLTEGIDVPALDAVLFLQPRKSQIDVVQAVGRVMRNPRNGQAKRWGYVILPIVVPAAEDPAKALDRNDEYAHVWEVLQALRSHDDRFDTEINKIEWKAAPERISVIGVGPRGGTDDGEETGADPALEAARQRVLDEWSQQARLWETAIFAKIVERCGDRLYLERWSGRVEEIARRHHERIRALVAKSGPAGDAFGAFVDALRVNLNSSIDEDDAAAMLSQHLVTQRVFDALFGSSEFVSRNPVSQAMQQMADTLGEYGLEAEIAELEPLYQSVEMRVSGIEDAESRQRIVTELYDKFFQRTYRREADRLGIVYTPIEIVDFIIRAVGDLLQSEFNSSIGDDGVHVLDPFTGTGTFMVRLIQSGKIAPDDLRRKYGAGGATPELHANEIMLLPYYIAAVNIEAAFYEAMTAAGVTEPYEPFGGIVLTDTFQSSEPGQGRIRSMLPRNSDRIERQIDLDIRVIIGNPPWSVGQKSQDDQNQNMSYPALDGKGAGNDSPIPSIFGTYVSEAAPGLKRGLYDSYVRAIRWASNRVQDSAKGGIIAYVTNSGFIDSKAFDGFRKRLASEFHEVHVYNLRGNARTSSEQRRREGGGVFEAGSRAGVAILLLVKRPGPVPATGAVIRYRDIGDYLSQEQKLERVSASTLADPEWVTIQPNEHGDWINQRSDRFLKLRSLAAMLGQPKDGPAPIFKLASRGVNTSRDAFVFSSSGDALRKRVPEMIKFYNDQVEQVAAEGEIERDPERFSWDGTLEALAQRGLRLEVQDAGFREAMYRPFFKQRLYLDRYMNNSVYQLPRIFADPEVQTPAIVIESKTDTPERTPGILAVNVPPDVKATSGAVGLANVLFPLYSYPDTHDDEQGRLGTADGIDGRVKLDHRFRRENFSEEALGAFRLRYGDGVSGDQIFAYVYGILHSPDYRERYAVDLAKMLPRIPEVASADDFLAFAEAGQALLDLHIGYEEVEPYSLREEWALGAPEGDERWRVEKMRWAGSRKEPDRSAIVVNEWLTLGGIPEAAHGYVVGPRSALEWLIDRYQVRKHKESGIVNDVNDWGLERGQPDYIPQLVKRIVTVSVETMRIVGGLPALAEAED